MDPVTPLTNSRSKADWFWGILLLATSLAGLIILWPHLFGELTVQELAKDFDTYSERSVRVRGRVVSLHPYPFSVGNVENVMMRLEDEGASINLIYDQLSLRYKPMIGDRVLVKGHIRSYGEYTPIMLIANKIKQLDNDSN